MNPIVRLRQLEEGDLRALHRWYQTEALWDHLVGAFTPRSEEEAIDHMRGWLSPSQTHAHMCVTRASDGALIGRIALSPIDPAAGEAEFHIFLGEPEDRGRGYGAAATQAMLEYAFDELELWRVRLRVLRTNAAALRLYARLGFSPDLDAPPTSVVKDGVLVEVIALSLTEATFRERQGQTQGVHR